MKITDILDKQCIILPLVGQDKMAVITELVTVLNNARKIKNHDHVLRAIVSRERTRSTGIGKGLAVPHGKSAGCSTLVMAVGRPQSSIEWESIDARPCELVVLLASPVDKTGPHIQALAGVSRLWLKDDFRRDVLSAETADELFQAFERYQDD